MAKTKKSSLKERLQKTSIRDKTRHKDPVAPGGGSLPAGIVGGIAKLTRLDFDVMDSGDYSGEQRLYAHGVCVKPKEFKDKEGNVHITEGSLVQLTKINLCDTKYQDKVTPFEENWEKAENRLKLLGIPTEDLDNDTFEEDVLNYVNTSELYFRFRTWKADDSDRVSVVLEGPIDFNPDASDDVQDDSSEESDDTPTPANPPTTKPTTKEKTPDKPKTPKTKETKTTPPKKEEPAADHEDEVLTSAQILKLGKLANKGDESLQVKLADMAEAVGIDTTDYDTWVLVAEAIVAKTTDDLEDEESEEVDETSEEVEEATEVTEEIVPAKGDIFEYNGTEVEVTGVFPSKKKVNLKDTSSGEVSRGVSWDQLTVI
jgi:hypothetical protein